MVWNVNYMLNWTDWSYLLMAAVCTVSSDGSAFHLETGLLHRIRQLEDQNEILAEQLR